MNSLLPVVIFIAGLLAGGLVVWLILKSRIAGAHDQAKAAADTEKATLAERLNAKEQQISQLDAAHQQSQSEASRLREELRVESSARSSEAAKAAAGAARVSDMEADLSRREESALKFQEEISNLRTQISERDTRLEEERKAAEEKQSLLADARTEFTEQFKNLASTILEDKSKKFTEQNRASMESLLNPLGAKILEFQTRVERTHVEDTKQRISISTQLENLKQLNAKISQDAINLTNALKGNSKTQGNWGEQILETILQNAGLIRGQHYDVQSSFETEDGRRAQPDVILHLPEDRHIIIDSKVNLISFTRFTEMDEGIERDLELKRHITAFRKHVSDLSGKEYQKHYSLRSLEFVLMFVPLEPAFMLALQTDNSIYDFAFQKRISIVTPSTLHAAVHTVSNIWRQDDQNKNALKIAKDAGNLYDKFVAFTEDLMDIGGKLAGTQRSYDAAMNKLKEGKGNLVGRVESLKSLGAKASKKLSPRLLEGVENGSSNGDEEIENIEGALLDEAAVAEEPVEE